MPAGQLNEDAKGRRDAQRVLEAHPAAPAFESPQCPTRYTGTVSELLLGQTTNLRQTEKCSPMASNARLTAIAVRPFLDLAAKHLLAWTPGSRAPAVVSSKK